MRELLTRLLDSLFPPTVHKKTLRTLPDKAFCNTYEPRLVAGTTALAHFGNPAVQAAVHENKFHHSGRGAKLLGQHLARHLANRTDIRLVPIPLGPNRERERGHNQVVSIIKAASLEHLIVPNVIKRSRDTEPQSRLDSSNRQENIKDAFTFHQLPDLAGVREIIIIDDVMTSGATLKEARAALAPHLPPHLRLSLLALAH